MTALYDKLAHHTAVYFKLNNLPPEHVEPLAQHLSGNTEPLQEGEPDPRLVRLVRAAEAAYVSEQVNITDELFYAMIALNKALAPYRHLLERAEKEN